MFLCKLSIKISCSYSASSFETHTFKVLFKFSIIVSVRRRRGGGQRTLISYPPLTTGGSWELSAVIFLPGIGKRLSDLTLPDSSYWQGPNLLPSYLGSWSHQSFMLLKARDFDSRLIKIYKKKLFLISVLPNSVLEILPGTKVLTGTTTFQKSEDFFYLRAE